MKKDRKWIWNAYPVVLACLVCLLPWQKIVHADPEKGKGQFYMISTGVGDSDLITLRAIKAIQESDIIICRPETREAFSSYLEGKIFWEGAFHEWRTRGKKCEDISDPQKRDKCQKDREARQELEARIRSAVKEGKTIAVLGNGDLFIFGGPYRWYREDLADLDIKTIPGVSCLNAANAVIGKDIMGGSSVHSAVLTHYQDIDKLARHQPTMIIFTMHTQFPDLVDKLQKYYPAATPIAIVFYAGYKDKEYKICGQLDTIAEKIENIEIPFEHLVYVGDFMERNSKK
jgi:precorrin-4 methylase